MMKNTRKFEGKVRHIISEYDLHCIENSQQPCGADALRKEYLNCSKIQEFLSDLKCTVILFENPPYEDYLFEYEFLK